MRNLPGSDTHSSWLHTVIQNHTQPQVKREKRHPERRNFGLGSARQRKPRCLPIDYLDFVASELNRRPRKRIGWCRPAEALDQLFVQST